MRAASLLLLLALVAWGCATVHDAHKGRVLVSSEEFYSLWPTEADSTETAR